MDEKGTLDNFKNGTLDGYATSVYRIGDGLVMGSRVFASWSTVPGNSPSGLFYDDGEAYAMVEGVVCSTGFTLHTVFLAGGEDGQQMEEWGTATECDAGPAPLNASVRESPPVILLSGGNNLHMIVEEDSSYPSFLYSVWQPILAGDGINASEPAELHHVFYVSSTTRLAEAIVSGVVNGIMSGGGCVDLLSQFSMVNTTYSLLSGVSRVAPFGEYPSFSSVESIDQVEAIVAGVKVSDVGMISGLILMVVTGVSFVGCLGSMWSREKMDVFDRDAVIRAVAIPNGGQEADITSPALKIYVRQSDDARFGMVVSDDAVRRRWISRCVKGVASALARPSPVDDGDADGDDDPLPARGLSRSWSLPRASFTSRVSSDREDLELRSLDEAPSVQTPPAQSPTYVELIASPIPSLARNGSVLRGLPTFLSRSMAAARLDNSSTDREHSSLTDQGHPSPAPSPRSMKGIRADSVLHSALNGKEAPPADAALSTTEDVGVPEPVVTPARQVPTTTGSVKKMGGIDTCNIAAFEGDVSAKEKQAGGGGPAEIVDADEAANQESTGDANTGAKRGTPQPQKARRARSTLGDMGVDAGARNGVDGSSQATTPTDIEKPTGDAGSEKAGDALPAQTPTAASEKNGDRAAMGTVNQPFGRDCVGATTPDISFGEGTAEHPAVPGAAEHSMTE